MIASALALALAFGGAQTAVAYTAAPSDNDRDGYADSDDCNDGDPDVNPGQPEDCGDGIDNDCDTYTDELDADCVSDDGGCAATPGSRAVAATLAGALLVSARRRRAAR